MVKDYEPYKDLLSNVWVTLKRETQMSMDKYTKKSDLFGKIAKSESSISKRMDRIKKKEPSTYTRDEEYKRLLSRKRSLVGSRNILYGKMGKGKSKYSYAQRVREEMFPIKQKAKSGKIYPRSYQRWEKTEIRTVKENIDMNLTDLTATLQRRHQRPFTKPSVATMRSRLKGR